MRCLCCAATAVYSVLLAGDLDGPIGRLYLPNQSARQEADETWFCHPCMRTIEDGLRATVAYLRSEAGTPAGRGMTFRRLQ